LRLVLHAVVPVPVEWMAYIQYVWVDTEVYTVLGVLETHRPYLTPEDKRIFQLILNDLFCNRVS